MVCSSCGFENPLAMRYCGMCGMPMPHKPITAPGAHSTLNFTRVPVDTREAASAREPSEGSEAGGSVAVERSSSPASRPQSGPLETATPATEEGPSRVVSPEAATEELVPDISLDEYVRKFRYEPPRDPAEKTMRWDAPVETPRPQPPIGDLPQATDRVTEPTLPLNTSAPIDEDVDSRLGLEPESPAEASIARPRFLDINEPPAPNQRPVRTEVSGESSPSNRAPAAGVATIVGPSFLGLSDSPQSWADAIGVERGEYAPRNYHWRAWFAAAVVLLFAGLGYLEWRAQVNQTNNGPVEVIRTKLRDWRQTASQMTDSAPSPGAAKPDIQVQPQTKPKQNANASAPVPGTTSPDDTQTAAKSDVDTGRNAASANTQPIPNTAPTAEPPKVATDNPGQAPAPEKPQTIANNSAEPPAPVAQPKHQPDAATPAPKPPVLGGEEMLKAKNGSDPAATAAWLWKATAKGNPDAPVQLASMYVRGDGVPRSCEQALVLLKTAAEKENAPARSRLGSMYANGTCVPASRVEAYRWYSSALAANPNSQWTQQTRDTIWQQMSPDERARAQKYR